MENIYLDSPLTCYYYNLFIFNPSLAEPGYATIANTVDPNQLASSEANWSGYALFVLKYVNLYQQLGSTNLTGWN